MGAKRRTNREIMAIYDRHVDTVYRVCFTYMKNASEAEDMTQETFLRLIAYEKPFENRRHEKAWLIVTASNLCKDALRKWWRYSENIEDYRDLAQENEKFGDEMLDAVMKLPEDYKEVIYMHYYEGYSAVEIADHLGCPDGTVRSRLHRAKKQLYTLLKEGDKC